MRYLTKYFKWNGGRNENILMVPETIYTFMKQYKASRGHYLKPKD